MATDQLPKYAALAALNTLGAHRPAARSLAAAAQALNDNSAIRKMVESLERDSGRREVEPFPDTAGFEIVSKWLTHRAKVTQDSATYFAGVILEAVIVKTSRLDLVDDFIKWRTHPLLVPRTVLLAAEGAAIA